MRFAALLGWIAVTAVLPPVHRSSESEGGIRCGIEMRNVALHVSDGVVRDVRKLDGEFVSD